MNINSMLMKNKNQVFGKRLSFSYCTNFSTTSSTTSSTTMGNCVHKLKYVVDHNAHLHSFLRGNTPIICKLLIFVVILSLVFLTLVLCIVELESYQSSSYTIKEKVYRLKEELEPPDIHIFNLNQVRYDL